MSELLWWLGKDDARRSESPRLFDEAIELRDRCKGGVLDGGRGLFRNGAGCQGKADTIVGSESAHALAAGIVHHNRATRTIERRFQPDWFSGWGLRTLFSRHKRFDPFSYHRGSVWAAEQAAVCIGLMGTDVPSPAAAHKGLVRDSVSV
jgi:glycogen debranching enzyme